MLHRAGVAPDRGRRRRRQPARGGRRAAPPPRARRRRASGCCRWAPATTSPAALGIPLDLEEAARRRSLAGEVRPMDLIVDELGEVVVNNVHVGAGAQASRRGAALEGAARLDRRRQGQPRQARLPDRRGAGGLQPAERAAARRGGRRGRHRPRPAGADGRGRQRRPRRRRHRAHPRGRPRGRQGRRDDLPRRRRRWPGSATPSTCGAASTTSATTCSTCAASQVTISGDEFWISADGEIYGPERQRTWHVEPAAYSLHPAAAP